MLFIEVLPLASGGRDGVGKPCRGARKLRWVQRMERAADARRVGVAIGFTRGAEPAECGRAQDHCCELNIAVKLACPFPEHPYPDCQYPALDNGARRCEQGAAIHGVLTAAAPPQQSPASQGLDGTNVNEPSAAPDARHLVDLASRHLVGLASCRPGLISAQYLTIVSDADNWTPPW